MNIVNTTGWDRLALCRYVWAEYCRGSRRRKVMIRSSCTAGATDVTIVPPLTPHQRCTQLPLGLAQSAVIGSVIRPGPG